MKFIVSDYFNKEYLKNKAKRIAKQTWAGPGKFGVFIVLCIIIVATFEFLGLSNREKNLESRNLSNMIIAIPYTDPDNPYIELNNETKINLLNQNEFNKKIKISTQKDIEDKNMEREKILLNAAVEQYFYENYESENVHYLTNEEKIKRIYSVLIKDNVEENQKDIISNDNFFFDI